MAPATEGGIIKSRRIGIGRSRFPSLALSFGLKRSCHCHLPTRTLPELGADGGIAMACFSVFPAVFSSFFSVNAL